eukprot:5058380-Pyramimonas_sp.AAC.1
MPLVGSIDHVPDRALVAHDGTPLHFLIGGRDQLGSRDHLDRGPDLRRSAGSGPALTARAHHAGNDLNDCTRAPGSCKHLFHLSPRGPTPADA